MSLELGRCFVCHKTAAYLCSICSVVRYCGRDCQRKDWKAGGHKRSCGELKGKSCIALEELVFDVSVAPPRVLLRPLAEGGERKGAPAPLTAAELASPVIRFPFSECGGKVPRVPMVGSFSLGTSVILGSAVGAGPEADYVARAPRLQGGCLALRRAANTRDTMFEINVLVEQWEKEGGAGVWTVEDVAAVVLERFRVKLPPSTPDIAWGADALRGWWAVVKDSDAPGLFCLMPHLSYHFTYDCTEGDANLAGCAVA